MVSYLDFEWLLLFTVRGGCGADRPSGRVPFFLSFTPESPSKKSFVVKSFLAKKCFYHHVYRCYSRRMCVLFARYAFVSSAVDVTRRSVYLLLKWPFPEEAVRTAPAHHSQADCRRTRTLEPSLGSLRSTTPARRLFDGSITYLQENSLEFWKFFSL